MIVFFHNLFHIIFLDFFFSLSMRQIFSSYLSLPSLIGLLHVLIPLKLLSIFLLPPHFTLPFFLSTQFHSASVLFSSSLLLPLHIPHELLLILLVSLLVTFTLCSPVFLHRPFPAPVPPLLLSLSPSFSSSFQLFSALFLPLPLFPLYSSLMSFYPFLTSIFLFFSSSSSRTSF